jgi:hypothetical protein
MRPTATRVAIAAAATVLACGVVRTYSRGVGVAGGQSVQEQRQYAMALSQPDKVRELKQAIQSQCDAARGRSLDSLSVDAVWFDPSPGDSGPSVFVRLTMTAASGVEAVVECGKQVLERRIKEDGWVPIARATTNENP